MKGCAFLRDRKGDERGTFGVLMAVGLTLLLQFELAVEKSNDFRCRRRDSSNREEKQARFSA